ncbi:hypothetical protein MATL_G00209350 [Megalops atlanticus]|uniref:Uncharacterized protein n=1 Tax=Megalops atlanticus TaxID=7932 RepID=A0A9D3PFH9_MEGAT|nr:hypothetical protein MATL_G00209350 [Megalops atlanticus]
MSSSEYLCVPQRRSSLPDETNAALLQEELKLVKLRELEILQSFSEMQGTVADLNQLWQIRQLCSQPSRYQSPGHAGFQSLCLASPASGEGEYLSSDDDLLPSPLLFIHP